MKRFDHLSGRHCLSPSSGNVSSETSAVRRPIRQLLVMEISPFSKVRFVHYLIHYVIVYTIKVLSKSLSQYH